MPGPFNSAYAAVRGTYPSTPPDKTYWWDPHRRTAHEDIRCGMYRE